MDINEMKEHIRQYHDAGGYPMGEKEEKKLDSMSDDEIKEWFDEITKPSTEEL